MSDLPAFESNIIVSGAQAAASTTAGTASVHSGPSMLGLVPDVSVPDAAVADVPNPTEAQRGGIQQLGNALQSVLSEGLSTDFVEGLKPVMCNGTLQISTHIQLEGESEPVFIGMFPDLQAAVNAQKQSQALVGKLPAHLARNLIQAQLTQTHPVTETVMGSGQAADLIAAPAAPVAEAAPSSASAPGSVAAAAEPVPLGSADQHGLAAVHAADAPTTTAPVAADDKQVDQQASLEAALAAAAAASQQVAAAAAAQSENVPLAAAAPSGQIETAAQAAPADGDTSAAAAGAAPTGAAFVGLTDDVINLLLRKGLHALATTTGQPKEGEGADGQQPQEPATGTLTELPPPAQLNTQPVTNMDTPYTAGAIPTVPAVSAAGVIVTGQPLVQAADAATAASLAQLQFQQQQFAGFAGQPFMLPAVSMGAVTYGAQFGAADPLLEYAAPHTQFYPAQSQAMAAGTGLPPRPQLDASWAAAGAAAQQQIAAVGGYAVMYQPPYAGMAGGADLYGRRISGTASDAVGYQASAAAEGYPAAAGYNAADWPDYSAAAAYGSAAASSTGSDTKRKRSDPRLNCIKSVQYRVSRFPSELHDMCVEHWERTRCARVQCNGVNGVMSVQGGRCVVSFTQHGQEVLKGVADYLRYAGEDRIKKWRRHVRMVDFPRPNNRTGELMTAEEFLCIVGYQSEQGGGKRPKYMSGAGADTHTGTGSD